MITPKEVTKAIHEQIESFRKEMHFPDPMSINNGGCMFFAEQIYGTIQETMPPYNGESLDQFEQNELPVYEILMDGTFLDVMGDTSEEDLAAPEDFGSKAPEGWDIKEKGLPSHYWVYFDGLHYDSETPEGVKNFFDLPVMQRYYEEISSVSR